MACYRMGTVSVKASGGETEEEKRTKMKGTEGLRVFFFFFFFKYYETMSLAHVVCLKIKIDRSISQQC